MVTRQVLDHGYVLDIDWWGSDQRIIEAARMSTDGGFRGWEKDMKLLTYLWTHKHLTPFEQCGATFEISAPIFVVREWMRHRTQSYNELSARYTELPDLYYIPSTDRLQNGRQDTKNKQSSTHGFDLLEAESLRHDILLATEKARAVYEGLLIKGVSRELARLVIPVNQYSRFRASANLRNWLQFLELRLADGAQYEIRQFAQAIAEMLSMVFPKTWELFSASLPSHLLPIPQSQLG